MKAEIIRDENFDAISLDGGKHWRYFVKDTRTGFVFVAEQEGHPEDESEFTGYALPSYFSQAMTEESLANADLDYSRNNDWIKEVADQGFLTTVRPTDWEEWTLVS